jgi:hypothetical protein
MTFSLSLRGSDNDGLTSLDRRGWSTMTHSMRSITGPPVLCWSTFSRHRPASLALVCTAEMAADAPPFSAIAFNRASSLSPMSRSTVSTHCSAASARSSATRARTDGKHDRFWRCPPMMNLCSRPLVPPQARLCPWPARERTPLVSHHSYDVLPSKGSYRGCSGRAPHSRDALTHSANPVGNQRVLPLRPAARRSLRLARMLLSALGHAP